MFLSRFARSFSTSGSKKFAIILSGCGVYDGSEIHESVFIMDSISKRNGQYQCFAPDIPQKRIINHLTGEPVEGTRNVLVESARIARSNVLDIFKLNARDFDCIVCPGGFGVIKNLSNFGSKGASMDVIESVANALRSFNEAKKPIGACCIAPVLLARLFPDTHLTLGQEKVCDEYPYADACGAVKAMGAIHVPCQGEDVCIDQEKRIVTTPAYMHNGAIHSIHTSIDKMIEELYKMIYTCLLTNIT